MDGLLTRLWSHTLRVVYLLHAAIQAIVPAVNCVSEYAVRVSSRIVAQVQDRVSTDWKWQVLAVCSPGRGCTRFDLVSVLWFS